MTTGLLTQLDSLTQPGSLSRPGAAAGSVICLACPHACHLRSGQRGRCGLRHCQDGVLRVPWGYVSGLAVDPIEKKPLFHVVPGSAILSFGMLGCSLHCPFCQNWTISQVGRDDQAGALPQRHSPEDLAERAVQAGCRWLAATYNEPLVAAEWVTAVFAAAQARGLRTAIVSNGFATPENLASLRPHLDAANLDLKAFTEAGYRWLGGHLQPVLDSLRWLRSQGVWVEVTTLVVPGFNDRETELQALAEFLVGISPDLPWHVSAYHPDYRLADGPGPTPPATVDRVCDLGRRGGLRYVYAGNLRRSAGEDTLCPHCGLRLVTRRGFAVESCRLTASGLCPGCQERIAGVWV